MRLKIESIIAIILFLGGVNIYAQEAIEENKSAIAPESPIAPSAPTAAPTPAEPAKTTAKQLNAQDLVDIEELYKSAAPPPAKAAPPKKSDSLTEEERKELEAIQKNADYQSSKLKSVADLNDLSPFTDVSMIQRKFLPKTQRFQIYTGLGLGTNSPWFMQAGGRISGSYNFSEKYGLELTGMFLSKSEKDSAKEIRENNSLQPERFVLMNTFIGADFVWSPIYGKISNQQEEIIPFDMYFAVGGGMASANAQEKTIPSFHLSTGQIFALSKGMAFRWDYSWYLYQATPERDSIATSAPIKNSYNDLIFTAGLSFFFPEVNYR